MPRAKRILISGYYGLSNAGDEAVLSAIIAGIRERSDAEITVLSASPAATSARHEVKALPRMSPARVRKAVRECDLFISGGGSLLQDATSFKSLAYYLLVIALAKRYRRKVMLLGQGIGPLRRSISRRLTARTLSGVDLIAVRDPQSAELLRELGVKSRIEVTADPTFALDPCPADEYSRLWRALGFGDGDDVLAVSLRGWPGRDVERHASEALAEIAQELPVKLLLVAMHSPDDEALARRVADSLEMPDRIAVQPEEWSGEQLLGVLGRCVFAIGMRLHALIFAAAAGVPSLGIEYDPKVEQFVKATGQAGIPLSEVSAGRLGEDAISAWSRRAELAARLPERIERMRKGAEENFRLAVELLGE